MGRPPPLLVSSLLAPEQGPRPQNKTFRYEQFLAPHIDTHRLLKKKTICAEKNVKKYFFKLQIKNTILLVEIEILVSS